MTSAHAYLPPSGAGAWVACAAWPHMQQAYPEREDKPDAIDGLAGHWAFTELLYGRAVSEGQPTPYHIPLSAEMVEGAELYVETVREAYQRAGSVSHYQVEQPVRSDTIHARNWGTPDTWMFGHDVNTGRARLVVLDYKFGHLIVDVFENWQLVNYVALLLAQLGIDGHGEQFVDVEMVVVQPRASHRDGPVRRWVTPAVDLRARFNILRMAAERAMADVPQAAPGPQCRYCSGRHACEALQRAGYEAAALARESVPLDLPTEAAGLEWRMLSEMAVLLEARVTGLAEQLEGALRQGAQSSYAALEPQTGRLAWTVPVPQVLALGAMYGHDLSKPGVLTPTQASKLLDPPIVASISARPPAGVKLVPLADKSARRIFST